MSEDALQRAMNFPLHRAILDEPEPRTVYSAPVPDCEETQSMLASAWFYGAGLVSIAISGGLFWLAYLWWRT